MISLLCVVCVPVKCQQCIGMTIVLDWLYKLLNIFFIPYTIKCCVNWNASLGVVINISNSHLSLFGIKIFVHICFITSRKSKSVTCSKTSE